MGRLRGLAGNQIVRGIGSSDMSKSIKETLKMVRSVLRLHRSRQDYVAFFNQSEVEIVTLPQRLWPTKSHEFWVFISLLLHKLRPKKMLELGSGRSTIYLSEYAGKCGARLLSVDQNRRWIGLNRLICRFGGLPEDFLQWVPLQDDGFYSTDSLDRFEKGAQFVLIDGPVARGSTESQMTWLKEAVETADLVILDDIHRRHIFQQIEPIFKAMNAVDRILIDYPAAGEHPNALCVMYSAQARAAVEAALACMDLEGLREYQETDCYES